MRAALWFLALFGIAAAVALFAGNNQSTVTVFWPPWRIDLSLNLVLLGLLGAFVLLHAASRALAALFDLPRQARRWRTQQKERAMHAALLDSLSHLLSGRFIRASKLSQLALDQASALKQAVPGGPNTDQVQALAHLVAAECAQSLQDPTARDSHLQLALEAGGRRAGQETREAATLSAARWALVQRDAPAALEWLDRLPQGAQRRVLALCASNSRPPGWHGAASRRWRPRGCWPSTGRFPRRRRRASSAAWPSTCSTPPTTRPSCAPPGTVWRPASA